MKKYIVTFFSTLCFIMILHLLVVGNSHFEREKVECTNELILYNTSTPNAVNHLGVPIEKFCTEWSK